MIISEIILKKLSLINFISHEYKEHYSSKEDTQITSSIFIVTKKLLS